MNTCSYVLVLCVGVVLSARLTMALGGFEMELLMTKMDFLQDKLQEVEQTMMTTMASSLKEMEHRLQEKLINHEKNINEKIESKMHEMKDTLKKSMETFEANTQKKLELLRNQLISNMNSNQLQLVAEAKTYQETTQTKHKNLEENKKTLEMLTDSVRNISTFSEKSKKILEAHLIYPVRSCRHVTKLSGRYIIQLNDDLNPFEVLCEQTKFEGGWTVIQHRFDGSVNFYRNWTEYRNGFGSLDGEFWLGLEYVHQLTKHRPHELLVEIKDFHGNYGYAKYGEFEIGSETEGYALKKLGTYSGTALDAMEYNINEKFSTFDRDNDSSHLNCAEKRHGAWWYFSCSSSNLNGRYKNTTDDESTMSWYDLKNDWRSLSYSRMMIRDIID